MQDDFMNSQDLVYSMQVLVYSMHSPIKEYGHAKKLLQTRCSADNLSMNILLPCNKGEVVLIFHWGLCFPESFLSNTAEWRSVCKKWRIKSMDIICLMVVVLAHGYPPDPRQPTTVARWRHMPVSVANLTQEIIWLKKTPSAPQLWADIDSWGD